MASSLVVIYYLEFKLVKIFRQCMILCTLITILTSSAKRDLIAEETVSSLISCFYIFAIVFFIKTAQGTNKMFLLDAHYRQISKAVIRRRASCAASDQGL